MIVKNEEKTIARILKCAKKFSDEIVVVDTGSTDNTKIIAKKYTNKVYYYVWNDNFADARNFSFSKATGTHIMWLDADDYITKSNIEKVKLLKNNDDFDFCMCKYKIGKNFEFYRERIVKNSQKFRWNGFIHEAIAPSGKIVYSDITIEHKKIVAGNPKRNLKIYQKHLKNNEIFDARETYYFAKEFFYNGYYSSCIKWLNRFLKFADKFAPNVLDAYITKSRCFYQKKQFDKSLNCLFEFLKNNQPNAEICCLIGDCFYAKNNLKTAVFWYKNALKCENNAKTGEFCNYDYSSIIPSLQLCAIYYKLGEIEKSKHFHKLSKKFSPNHPSVIYNENFFKNIF